MAVQIKTERVISLENINKSYQQPNGQQITILENISLELRPGEIFALLGPSGAGKSTLMRIIAGLILATQGQILYHNRPLVGLNPGVAIVFQSFAYPWLTILENIEAQNTPRSVVLDFLRRSPTLRVLNIRVWKPLGQAFNKGIVQTSPPPTWAIAPRGRSPVVKWLNWLFLSGVTLIILWGTWEAAMLLRVLNWAEWQTVIIGAILTSLRVLAALVLSLAWTVPVGVAIGRNPRLAQVLQPFVQIAASIPATALFPVLLLALAQLGGGLQIGSIVLMMLGTMWYLLFNVIAGAQSFPSDLFEAARIYKLSRWQRWQTVILPGIFPYLITGIITAVGGAWNASIVSEYIEFQGRAIATAGLGATISEATATGNFPLLLAATAVMSLVVVLTNRIVWRPLYRLAQEKYQLLV